MHHLNFQHEINTFIRPTFGGFRCEFCVEVEGVVHHPTDGGLEWRRQFAAVQHVPVYRGKERVFLDVLDAVTCNT